MIVQSLPFLHQYSEGIIKFFAQRDATQLERLHNDLEQQDSRATKKLAGLVKGFRTERAYYGHHPSISVDLICPACVGIRGWRSLANQEWRPDAVLYMANIARFASALFAPARYEDTTTNVLEQLYRDFPATFLPFADSDQDEASGIYTTRPIKEGTASLVLDIRTQYLIHRLRDEADLASFDPDTLLKDVFVYTENEVALRGVEPLSDSSRLSPEADRKFRERIVAIREYFLRDANHPVNWEGLKTAFPYLGFLTEFVKFVKLIVSAHRNMIDSGGGVDQIQENIEREFKRARGQSSESGGASAIDEQGNKDAITGQLDNPKKTKSSKESRRRSLRKSEGYIKGTKQQFNELVLGTATRSNKERDRPVSADHVQISPATGEEDYAHSLQEKQVKFQSSQQAKIVMQTIQHQDAQSRKENIPPREQRSFIDRQAGAERVSFDSQNEVAGPSITRDKGKKRVHPDEEEDDEYVEDTRGGQATNRRAELRRTIDTGRRTSKPIDPSPAKRQRRGYGCEYSPTLGSADSGDDGDEAETAARQNAVRAASASRSGQRVSLATLSTSKDPLHEQSIVSPSSLAPGPTGGAAEHSLQEGLYDLARTYSRAASQRKDQIRRPFTEAETQRLIDLIAHYGCSWSLLKQKDYQHPDGALLEHRDQVSLKDKARNLKMDFLKWVIYLCSCPVGSFANTMSRSKCALPEGFEDVRLGQRLASTLHSLNISYQGR